MKNWIVNNFWIKIISLILAVITWFYVNGELYKERRISREPYKTSLAEKEPPSEKTRMNKGYITEKK
ncbi:MAG: hypothetical protein V3S13_00835 [Candidatus Omnitrophota bacterium]